MSTVRDKVNIDGWAVHVDKPNHHVPRAAKHGRALVQQLPAVRREIAAAAAGHGKSTHPVALRARVSGGPLRQREIHLLPQREERLLRIRRTRRRHSTSTGTRSTERT